MSLWRHYSRVPDPILSEPRGTRLERQLHPTYRFPAIPNSPPGEKPFRSLNLLRSLPVMDSSIVSPSVALAAVLSGALILLFSAALIHLLLLRRKAKRQARAASRRLIALDGHGATTTSQSDSDLGSLEAAEGGGGGAEEEKGSSGSRLSLNLTPNQPIFVDVDVYGGGATGAWGGGGLQLILTPPTPRRVNREIP
ncbi:hypothetical protein EDB86DRAFT_2835149 [Lactarius hatsudake]|nr:hypothetical protein EDB86DRAFT_2835149 [Lactarius hatsudake]